ncbi:MAG: hypothetical protein JWO67_3383 [Streptosporangiaceae bacterium]|jgi:hypothetical protein|nr:hypothetical protein [Streptosporangiaceae bacterium]
MASPPSAEPVPSPAKSPRAGRPWAPAPRTPWQWQLTTPVDQSVNAPVYDIDGFENSAEVVRALHGQNRRVICYVNVGAAEDFRPDYRAFPAGVLGKRNGWAGERWLDIRRLDVLGPVMAKRLNMCQAKGFDAVEPDLVEGYTASTGFPLAAADQLRYNRFIARLAHERGMSVGLKNDLGQIPSLLKDFDFAVSEECAQFRECHLLSPFIKTGKAVLHVEYKLPTEKFCAQTKALGFSSMRKRLALGTWRQPC